MNFSGIRSMLSLFFIVILMGLSLLGNAESKPAGGGAVQTAKYKVYCVNGRIEIDTHTLDEMKSSRGQNVCRLTETEFDTLSQAREAAKRFGGVGAPCRCP